MEGEKGYVVDAVFTISVAARMVGVHAQTLRYYERGGLVKPARSQGQIRFYSPGDIERLRQIKTLIDELGVNLAGVDVILRLTERMLRMDEQMKALQHMVKEMNAEGTTGKEGTDHETG
ncbi:MAG: helix-turn-helix transcriptional regulator [Dehalococcoidia bacterium]|jgi:MerR family transcriptional regulator/heat shock protein HspR|nr:helix-turn-helix transcriptional regulator [Dehalococcoidia bacterium]MDP7239707.1 helix-turn-helix transcriptional regulator [Dehalococcoidia bacterium]MDP7469959.1 helix-turn-helix transcriptional regulator [Dehalococcoidia bacterium]